MAKIFFDVRTNQAEEAKKKYEKHFDSLLELRQSTVSRLIDDMKEREAMQEEEMEQRELRMRVKEKRLEQREKELAIREGACMIKEDAVSNMQNEVAQLNIQKAKIKIEIVNCKRAALEIATEGYAPANKKQRTKKGA